MHRQRLFVGLPLSPMLADALDGLVSELRPLAPAPCAWTRPGTWHVTLKFLGDTGADRLFDLEQALAGVRFAPFTLRAGRAGTFPPERHPRVLTLGLARGAGECAALALAVDAALAPLGFAPETRPYVPHLTLARVKSRRGRALPAPSPRAVRPARPGSTPERGSTCRAEPKRRPGKGGPHDPTHGLFDHERPTRQNALRLPGEPGESGPAQAEQAEGFAALLRLADAYALPEARMDRFVLWRSFLAADPEAARHGLAAPAHLAVRSFAAAR